EVGVSLDHSLILWGRRDYHKPAAVLIQLQRRRGCADPAHQPERTELGAGIKINIRAIELYQGKISIQLRVVQHALVKKFLPAAADPQDGRLKAAGPGKSGKEQGNVFTVTVAALEHIVDILVIFEVLSLCFLFAALALIGQVTDLLRASVE